jgi:hypothetical protein
VSASALNAAVGRGAFSTAIGGLSAQSSDNHDEISDLRQQLAFSNITKLAKHVIEARAGLANLRREADAIRTAENATREEIKNFRKKFPPAPVQEQRERIREITGKLHAIARTNAELVRSAEELEKDGTQRTLPFEKESECDEVMRMEGELREKRKHFCDKCDELIEIRSRQVKDVADAGVGNSGEEEKVEDFENVQIGFEGDGM